MPNTALGRNTAGVFTNKSGGALAYGDVVVIDGTTAAAVTTNTAGAYISGPIGVVIEPNGIANNAAGMIAFEGAIPKINLSSSASLADLFKTHTVAGQAVRHAAPMVSGDFGIVLGTGTTPAAWLFGSPSGAGSPSVVNEYVTSAAAGDLSAEVNIPGLAGSPDRLGIGGGGSGDKEWDNNTDPFTWEGSAAPATHDSDTTIPSHYYFRHTANSTLYGYYAWAPSGGWTWMAKCSVGFGAYSINANYKIGVFDSAAFASVAGCAFQLSIQTTANAPMRLVSITGVGGTFTARATTEWRTNSIYLKIVNDGSNNNSFYFSNDGLVWWLMNTTALTFTVARVGISVFGAASQSVEGAIDWIRTQD